MELTELLDKTDRTLRDNPFSLMDLIKRMALNQCAGKQQAAQADFDRLYPLLGHSEAITILSRIMLGKLDIRHHSGVFFLGEAANMSEDAKRQVSKCSSRAADLLESPLPVLLVYVQTAQDCPPYAVRICNGAGILCLPMQQWRESVLVHEITHCIQAAGHHFLDEALAYYAERILCDSEPAPLPDQAQSLRQCLQIWDVSQLDGLGEAEVLALYQVGARWLEWLRKRTGLEKINAFYRKLPLLLTDGNISEVVETHFGINLSEADTALSSSTALPSSGAEKPWESPATEIADALNAAYFSGELSAVPELLQKLPLDQPEQDQHVLAAVIRGLFVEVFYREDIDSMSVNQLLGLIECFRQIAPETPEFFVFSVMAICVRMRNVASYIEIQELASEVNVMFERGLSRFPDNGELNLMKGKSLYEQPESQGGDPASARKYFAKAVQDPKSGRHIWKLASEYL